MNGEVLQVEKGIEYEISIYKSAYTSTLKSLEKEISTIKFEKNLLEEKLQLLESKYIEMCEKLNQY